MVKFPLRLTIARRISPISCFCQPVCSGQSVSSHHFSTSPQALREEFFQDTSRRWIFNESDRLSERYVKFRPTELQRIAGEALQQGYCPDIAKLAEGGFNKVFLLRAKNGHDVIARIPTPVAGPPHYTTASEVATMDFLRTVLKLLVPEVLEYSTSSDNPVGAEYILMERVEGESLSSRWLSLTTNEVKDIMTQIADMERKIFDFYFPAYGSLYHKKDLDGETQIHTDRGRFLYRPCICPAGLAWRTEQNRN